MFLSDLELAAGLKASQGGGEGDTPLTSPAGHTLAVGGSVTGTIQEVTDFGLTVDLDQHQVGSQARKRWSVAWPVF